MVGMFCTLGSVNLHVRDGPTGFVKATTVVIARVLTEVRPAEQSMAMPNNHNAQAEQVSASEPTDSSHFDAFGRLTIEVLAVPQR